MWFLWQDVQVEEKLGAARARRVWKEAISVSSMSSPDESKGQSYSSFTTETWTRLPR